jgi:hypothetical protein
VHLLKNIFLKYIFRIKKKFTNESKKKFESKKNSVKIIKTFGDFVKAFWCIY